MVIKLVSLIDDKSGGKLIILRHVLRISHKMYPQLVQKKHKSSL